MGYIEHPFILKNSLESREYQENIVKESLGTNTLVVLPTGLGKTAIAISIAANSYEKKKARYLLWRLQNLLLSNIRNLLKNPWISDLI